MSNANSFLSSNDRDALRYAFPFPFPFTTTLCRERYKYFRRTERERIDAVELGLKDRERLRLFERQLKYPRVPTEMFSQWLKEVKGIDSGNADKHSLRELNKVLKAIEKLDDIDVEAFIRSYEVDMQARFDISFCRYQHRVAVDSFALFIYVPFVFLLSFFLIEGKGLGTGYWMNANIEGFFLEQEFENSNDLRFVKTYWDIGSDGEFWEFVTGPLMGGLWPNPGEPATGLIQQSLMGIGGLKVRQIRVEGSKCSDKLSRMFSQNVGDLLATEGTDYVRSRMEDFSPRCYPELNVLNTNVDEGPYPIIERLHDGIAAFSMNDSRNPSGWSGALNGGTDLPPMFLEQVFMTDDMVIESQRFVLDAFKYHTCDEFNASKSSWLRGKYGVYHCGGHGMVIPFSWSQEKVAEAFATLQNGITVNYVDPRTGKQEQKQIAWLDAQTRSLGFEIVFYSKDINLFSYAHLLVERTAAGCYIPVKALSTFQLFDYREHSFAYFFFLGLYGLYILSYWVAWIWSLAKNTISAMGGYVSTMNVLRCSVKSFFKFWVVYDLLNLTLFLVAWTFRTRLWLLGLTNQSVLQTEYYPDEYESVAMTSQLDKLISAGNGFLTFCRVFYFLRLNPHLNVLTLTLEKAAPSLSGIMLIFLIVFMSFSLLTYVVYGLTVFDFRSFDQTIWTLCRMLIGDFDFQTLMIERRIMTPVFFIVYNALGVFLLLNMVVAILDQAHSQVMGEKYNPEKLLKVINNSDDPELEIRGNHNKRAARFGMLASNPISKEVVYWVRVGYLQALVLTGQYSKTDKRWMKKLREAQRHNPRVYWGQRVEDMEIKMNTYNFSDRCRLISRQFDSILMDKFGKDFKLLADTLVFEPAQAMREEPGALLSQVLHFHHLWRIKVEAVTQTGKTVKEQKEKEEKEYVY